MGPDSPRRSARCRPLAAPPSAGRRRLQGQRGSALLLVPAGFVAFLVLAAIAFDQSRLFAARRQLIDVAASAANDAVAAGLDRDAYRAGEGRQLEPGLVAQRAEEEVAASLAARGLDDVRATVSIVAAEAPMVVVRLDSDLPTLFARLAPGGYGRARLAVTASATFAVF